jgi:hypothetical protein
LTYVAIVLGLAGCGGGDAPQLPVSGSVTLEDGSPLTQGKLIFGPTDQNNRAQPIGTVGSDGRYQVTTRGKPGAPAGKYVVYVQIEEKDTKVSFPSKYGDPNYTTLKVEVKKDAPAGSYDLKLTK